MKLTPQQMDKKIDEHFTYEANDDVAGVLATLAPDATHDIVGYPTGPTHGREAARAFYEGLFSDLSDGKATSLRRLYGDQFMVDESVWEGRAPGHPFGLDGGNRPLSFRLLHVVEFNPEGQIQKEQVWLDMAAILQQLSPATA
jgi:predicted ester cyclase